MQFAMYLVDNGVISHRQFYEALKLQMRSRPQLGALAIQTRRLNIKQMFSILHAQCDTPNELFGEIAVRLGYMTPEDLSQLLDEQSRRMAPLRDVLVEHGYLSADLADQHFAAYRRSANRAKPEVELANA